MYQIRKQFSFSAAHQLMGLPQGHQCGRLHGHNYIVELVLESDVLNKHGFVVDYGELVYFRQYLDEVAEHYCLNDVYDFQPSAENLAAYYYGWCHLKWPEIAEVRVSETPKTWASFRPPVHR